MTTGTTVLETHDLVVGHGKVPILEGLDLKIEKGEIVAILGRNGVGKTTLLETVAGVIPRISGEVSVNGNRGDLPLFKQVRKGLGFVPETRGVVHRLTV